jgi:hypothetical protein
MYTRYYAISGCHTLIWQTNYNLKLGVITTSDVTTITWVIIYTINVSDISTVSVFLVITVKI